MPSTDTRPLSETLKGYGRGVVGGLIFALAPLYTIEIWWQGFIASPEVLIVATLGTFLILVAYAHYAGLHSDRSLLYNAFEALETITLGFIVAFVVLKLVGQLPWTLSFIEFVSRLTIEGLTTSIGVAIGSTQLGQDPNEDQQSSGGEQKQHGYIHDVAYSVLGAMIIVAGFTPTQEIMIAALEATPLAVLGTMVLSFLLALGVESYFDFRGANPNKGDLYIGGPLGDALVTYAIALSISAVLLWSVGRFDGTGFTAFLCMTVYLALPATLGAAVGRLLL